MSTPLTLKTLGAIPLFRDLSEAQLDTMRQICRQEQFAANTVLIEENTPPKEVYIVLSGSVKIAVRERGGGEVILGLRGIGEVLGEMSLIDGQSHSATVVTQEDTTLLCLDRMAFWGYLWEMPPANYNLACILTYRLRLATWRIQALAAPTVEARLARLLLSFARGYEVGDDGAVLIPLHLSEVDLANMTGAVPSQVGAVLDRWQECGIIAINPPARISIRDF